MNEGVDYNDLDHNSESYTTVSNGENIRNHQIVSKILFQITSNNSNIAQNNFIMNSSGNSSTS